MGDTMLALTALRADVVQQLLRRGTATVELISYDNVQTALKLREGDKVFVTDDLGEDISRGTQGVVCIVERISIDHVRVRWALEVDEREILRARLRLKALSPARVRKASEAGVEIEEFTHALLG